MALIVNNEKKSKPIDDGVYQAICVGLYDLGTQHNVQYDSYSRKVLVMWELPEVLISFEKDGKTIEAPRIVSKQYTMSLGEKANLRKDLVAWRGRAFTDEELTGFDLAQILGKPCMIQILNQVAKNGKSYSNITGIMPVYKGINIPKPSTEIRYFSMDDHVDIPSGTPQWISDIITKSDEWASCNTSDDVPIDVPNDDCPF